MKKITKNVSFGKYALIANIFIMCVFIISMVFLMKFDKVNIKLVNDTSAYNQAEAELRKVEEPRKKAQAEVDYYSEKLAKQQQTEVPSDRKKIKEYQEDIERTLQTIAQKKEDLAEVDAAIRIQNILFEAVKIPFDDLTKQVQTDKSIFLITFWITILLFITKIAFFAAWKYRCLLNLHHILPWMQASTMPFWAYLGWIIPGYNLIKPYTVFSEILNETNEALAEKGIIKKDTDAKIDFNVGIWWGLLLIATVLIAFILNGTFFNIGSLYYKLSHLGVVIIAIISWILYLLQESSLILKGIKMNQDLFENRSKFDQ